MNRITHNAILSHYTQLYKKFGQSPASLGWPKGRQKIRFMAMSEIGNLNNSKILDVGCGFGDFAKFLNSQGMTFSYTGVDINPIFIKIAKQENPKYTFQTRDMEKSKFKQNFDWVFAIGVTNKHGSYRYIENLLKEMLRISKKGIAMDFLSSYVDFRGSGDYHVSPEKIFKIAKKLSRRVVIRHDYLPYQFCLYVYKNDHVDKNGTFLDWSDN